MVTYAFLFFLVVIVYPIASLSKYGEVRRMKNNLKLYPLNNNPTKGIYPTSIIQIGAYQKWLKNIKGRNVIVALLDTGVDYYHPNLRNQVIDGYNFSDEGNANCFLDYNGHGTHVAGIIVGKSSLDNLFTGIAPEAKILALKVLDKNGTGKVKSLIDAIHYSIDWIGPNKERVDVINISLGVQKNDILLHNAVKRAVEAQIPIIAAAGNYGDNDNYSNEYSYPGAYKEVIEVGAVDENNIITSFTNTNEEIDIYGPGHQILSTYLDKKLIALSGTSMAAPHITGAIALLIEEQRNTGKSEDERTIFSLLCKNTKSMELDNSKIKGCGALFLT